MDESLQSAEALDAYLQDLQAGRRPDRAALLKKHPELAALLDCVDALESLAPGDVPDEPPDLAALDAPVACFREFGNYELLEEIGRGGMGVVFKARQKGLDRLVAIKMILASHLASAHHVRRFQDEARAAARLHHPHIVRIHEVGQCHGQHFFAMEYVEGTNLADRIAQRPMEFEAAVRIVQQVARAVHHLHENGIVHRDLKPSNILLDNQGQPYVADFGLAKHLAADAQASATVGIAGTVCYMAPEQAAGATENIGPAADVYSLGVILYELLTGRPPFREESFRDTLLQVLFSEPPPPRTIDPRIPRELDWICLRCLARAPEQRYRSAAALADDLDRFLRCEVLEARPPGVVQRLWSWIRREPALASRLGVFSAFFGVNLLNYYGLKLIDSEFYGQMTLVIALWIATAILFQRLLKSRWSIPARLGWGMLDSLLLLGVLLVANGVVSPLIVGYFLLIVGSGLWNRVRFVWAMTGLSVASYGVLVFDYFHRRSPDFRATHSVQPDYFVIFVLAMLGIGLTVAYLVARIRALTRYFGDRLD